MAILLTPLNLQGGSFCVAGVIWKTYAGHTKPSNDAPSGRSAERPAGRAFGPPNMLRGE